MQQKDELPKEVSDAPEGACADAAIIVRNFLSAMEARDLETASSLLSKGFTMQFPGTEPMTELQQLLDWAKPRYSKISKSFEGFDTIAKNERSATVYCYGRLSGTWPDGTSFDNIRFIDRFDIQDGKIFRQDVWNDIAEIKAQNE